jgi:hypothetical protein
MRKFIEILSILFLLILAVGAFYGGFCFITDPSGNKIGIDSDLILNTPFYDYLIPGIILVIFNGFFPLWVIISYFKKSFLFPWLMVIQGCELTVWLSVELMMNKDFFFPIMHFPLYLMSLIFMIFGIILIISDKKSFKKKKNIL